MSLFHEALIIKHSFSDVVGMYRYIIDSFSVDFIVVDTKKFSYFVS
jgi:hypothetical protein